MAKYEIETTSKFKKDLKKYVGKGKSVSFDEFEKIIDMLADDIPLPAKYCDHPLKNNFKGFRECHIKPDLVLIYKKKKDRLILTLCKLNSHSNLFK